MNSRGEERCDSAENAPKNEAGASEPGGVRSHDFRIARHS